MTRLLSLFAVSLSLFLLVACSNPEAEKQIRDLEVKKTELEARIQALQSEADSLRVENQKMQDKLSALDMN